MRRLPIYGAVLWLTAMALVVDARPAAAAQSAGTVTVHGVYAFQYSWVYDWPWSAREDASLGIRSSSCADTWAGTTPAASGGGISCGLDMGGTHGGAGFRFSGTYAPSGGGAAYSLDLTGDVPTFIHYGFVTIKPPVSHRSMVLTGTVTGYDHDGPATATYALHPMSSSSMSCAFAPDDCYYYNEWGEVTLTLEYDLD